MTITIAGQTGEYELAVKLQGCHPRCTAAPGQPGDCILGGYHILVTRPAAEHLARVLHSQEAHRLAVSGSVEPADEKPGSAGAVVDKVNLGGPEPDSPGSAEEEELVLSQVRELGRVQFQDVTGRPALDRHVQHLPGHFVLDSRQSDAIWLRPDRLGEEAGETDRGKVIYYCHSAVARVFAGGKHLDVPDGVPADRQQQENSSSAEVPTLRRRAVMRLPSGRSPAKKAGTAAAGAGNASSRRCRLQATAGPCPLR